MPSIIKEYYHDIDQNKNQLLNSRVHNITTSARIILGGTLGLLDKGFQVFDTDLSAPYYWDGSAWVVATVVIPGVTAVTASAPLSSTGGFTPDISISQATTSTDGYLSSTDWNLFDGKQSALTFSLPLVNTLDVISIPAATTLVDGYLTAIDWTTFNSKFTLPSLTAGSVLFSDGTTIAQDNANFFWDDTNNRLGIGNAIPAHPLDVTGVIRGSSDALINTLTVGKGSGSIATNTAIGNNALVANTTGFVNTAIGYSALLSTTTGAANTATGYQALTSNITGGSNVAVGYQTLSLSTAGNWNTAIGSNCMTNATGSQNSAIGFQALDNVTGTYNVGNGYRTLRYLTSGGFNTAIGAAASNNVGTGIQNVSIGYASLAYGTVGNANSNNTALGFLSLGYMLGSNNAALGFQSGRYIANGSTNATAINNSILIGYNTKVNANSQTNQIVIGYDETGLGSNTTIIGNSSTITTAIRGNLLLGTTTDAGQKLQVTGTAIISSTTTLSVLAGVGSRMVVADAVGELSTTAIPSLTGYVPYTGATTNLDLGLYNLTATQIIKAGGTSSQFLKADGSVDSTAYGTGTVTSVAALTLGTTGTDLSSTVATGTTTPVITLNVPTASATNRGVLSTTDWSAFNGKFTLPALTSGSVLFSNGTTIAQDNANFFWNDTNNRLGLGTNVPISPFNIYQNATGLNGITITGYGYYTGGPTNATQGVGMYLFYNGPGNRQILMGATDGLGSASLGMFRLLTAAIGYASIDAVSGDGATRLLTMLGTDTSNIGVGYDSTVPSVGLYTAKINSFTYNTNNANLQLRKFGTAIGNFVEYIDSSAAIKFFVSYTGNTGIGTATDAGYKLDVNGTTRLVPAADASALVSTGYNVTGSGATSMIDLAGTWNTTGTPTAFKLNVINTASTTGVVMDLQVGGASIAKFRALGDLIMPGAGQFAELKFQSGGINYVGTGISTTGTLNLYGVTASFVPTSGSASWNVFSMRNTINQTGTASGIIRGVYIAPTLTAAADFRAIETTVGKVIFNGTGNVLVGTSTDDGQKFQVNGLSAFTGTTASDAGVLGGEQLIGGTGTNWTGTSFATGYTHTTGSADPLTSTLAAINNTYYQITYTVTGRTFGSFVLAYGGYVSGNITATGNVGPRATSTAILTLTPSTDFDGTVVVSVKAITASSATLIFKSSAGTVTNELRASSLNSNTFLGLNAGAKNTTGTNNTVFGSGSLQNNTTGFSNTAIGLNSLLYNTEGNYNTAIGSSVLQTNTIGIRNVGVGSNTLIANTTGNQNVGVGSLVLQSNTIGNQNVGVGYYTMSANNTGSFNSAIGTYALSANISGGYNSAMGYGSLGVNTIGGYNSALGYNALSGNLSGGSNVALGMNAGTKISGGVTNNTITNNSIYLGTSTKALADNQTNQIVIGYDETGLGSNTTILGNSSTVTTAIRGNLLLGSTSDGGQILQANGLSAFIGTAQTGAGAVGVIDITQTWNTTGNPTAIKLNVTNTASGASSNLMDLQVGGVSKFKVDKAGAFTAQSFTLGAGGSINTQQLGFINVGQSNNTGGLFIQSGGNIINGTSGIMNFLSVNPKFTVSSGTGTVNNLTLTPILNTTGTYNGIVRGLYYNPTLTSTTGMDLIAIETTVGKVIFNGAGNVLIGTSTDIASSKLTVESTTQGFLPPRMTTTQKNAIVTPAVGLMVYQTDGTEGVYVYTSAGIWRGLTMV